MKKLVSLTLALALALGPVSYTHLDVYKRQGLHSPDRAGGMARTDAGAGSDCKGILSRYLRDLSFSRCFFRRIWYTEYNMIRSERYRLRASPMACRQGPAGNGPAFRL